MSIKILLIEDNPDHAQITKRVLEKTMDDCRLDLADDSQESLKLIFENNYDLILCDYRMPGLTALDILREIKNKGKDLPFVVVTASGNEKAAVELMKEGAYDYVLKDISYEETLPVVVERSIERYHSKKEKERLEEKIEQAAREWEITFNSITDMVSIHELNYKFIRANQALLGFFKIEPEELIHKTCYEVFHATKEPLLNCPRKQVLETKKSSTAEIFEPRLGIYFEISVSPIFNEKEEVIRTVHIVKDITERKKAQEALEATYQQLKATQEQLIQSTKMAAMGQLAAGISHELNQPLTGIKGFTQAVLMDLEKESPFRNDLNKIVEQVDRMDTIIKNVRLFARKSDFEIVELDVNQVVLDSLMLVNQQLKVHNIRLIQELGSDIPKIQGDPNQLQQAFLNLISNARDAIFSLNRPEGGEIRVRTSLSQDKEHVEITFQDTGCAIPEENLQHIFSPFFTTKSPGKGMGLGLSITYRIIENHQGKISFQSKEGKGTIFNIALPLERKEDETGKS